MSTAVRDIKGDDVPSAMRPTIEPKRGMTSRTVRDITSPVVTTRSVQALAAQYRRDWSPDE